MDKIKTVKIKNQDGSISEESYTISVDARNVDMDNGKDLQDTIGTIDINTDGNIAEQLKNLNDNVDDLNIDIKMKAYFFDTVADMKAANLKNGDYACTLGYYEANDGGAGEYRIINNSSNYYEKLNNNLFAELIIKNEVNVKQFGAYGDGTHDDSLAINNALNLNNITVYVPKAIYLIDSELLITSNNLTIIGDNSEFKHKYGNTFSGQSNAGFINFRNNTNLIIKNIIFNNNGEWVNRPAVNDETYEDYYAKRRSNYHAIALYNVSHFYIDNCIFEYGSSVCYINSSNNGNITNCLSQKSLSDGYFIEGNSYDINVTDCKTYNVDDDSFSADGYSTYANSPKRILFNNCIARDSFGALCCLLGSSYTKMSNSIGYNLRYVPVKLGILKNANHEYVGTSANYQQIDNCVVYLSGDVRSDGTDIGISRFASKMIDATETYQANNLSITNCKFYNNGDNNLYMVCENTNNLKFINNDITGKLGIKFNNNNNMLITNNRLNLLAPLFITLCNDIICNNNIIRNSQDITWGIGDKNIWINLCNNVQILGNDILHKISFENLTVTDTYQNFKTDETVNLGFKTYQSGIQILGIYVTNNHLSYTNYVEGQLIKNPTTNLLRMACSDKWIILYQPTT